MTDIVKILHQGIKRLFNKKGQGLVEFALILAFCVGIGLFARDTGMLDAFSESFNQGILAFLNTDVDEKTSSGNGSGSSGGSNGGETGGGSSGNNDNGNSGNSGNGNSGNGGNGTGTDTGTSTITRTGTGGVGPSNFDWGLIDPKDYYKNDYDSFTKESSQADRLKADQNALANIALHFIGLTQNKVIALLGNKADMADNKEITLGHFIPNIENGKFTGGMRFETQSKTFNLENGETLKVPSGSLKKAEQQNIFAWMQGYQDTNSDGPKDKNGVVINENYDPKRMYLVSDYVVSQDWADNSGSDQQNGLKIKLEYNYSGNDYNGTVNTSLVNADDVVVVGVHVFIDPMSQSNEMRDTGLYNSMTSKGLDMQVRKNPDGSLYVTQVDTGKIYKVVKETDNNGNVIIDENGQEKTKLQAYEQTDANTLVVSGGNARTSQWYGNGYNSLVEKYIKNQSTPISGQYQEFDRGSILNQGNVYYVATRSISGTIDTKTYNSADKLEKQYGLVKFTSSTGNYWHENGFKNVTKDKNGVVTDKGTSFENGSFLNRTYTNIRGVPVTLDTGEIYVYVGQEKNWEYTGIDDTNFIKIRESTIEQWSFN